MLLNIKRIVTLGLSISLFTSCSEAPRNDKFEVIECPKTIISDIIKDKNFSFWKKDIYFKGKSIRATDSDILNLKVDKYGSFYSEDNGLIGEIKPRIEFINNNYKSWNIPSDSGESRLACSYENKIILLIKIPKDKPVCASIDISNNSQFICVPYEENLNYQKIIDKAK